MSLRLKFFVVLTMLGLTLAANVALSVWSIRFLERELAWPLRSAQPVLGGLHSIKRLGEQQASELGNGRSEPMNGFEQNAETLSGTIIELERRVLMELDRMEQVESLRLRSGVSNTENLRSRSGKIMELAQSWADQQALSTFEELVSQIDARHELIERIEGRIIEDAALANTYGERLRVLIYSIIGVALLGAALVAVFSVILLRRWVLMPVGLLRRGAQSFAKGEFDHQIRVPAGDELGQLGDEFNHMASMIQTMQDERVERERLAAMGEMAQRTVHNLRTPLAGIRSLAETTQRELEESSELLGVQQRIIDTVDRFEGWLQAMLRVSSPLELQHRAYSPLELVNESIDLHRGAAESRSVEIVLHKHSDPPQCHGDPEQLGHALTALLSNAIEYAPAGSQVELKLDLDDDCWTLDVCDSGPGIEADLQVAIFRPYFTTRKGGTGIGLALVKRIIDQHRGKIGVQSPWKGDSEQGTAFMLRIPLHAQFEGKG